MGTGLTSGIDYTTMITQLMQIEAQPQQLLQSKLADVQKQAAALRQVNTSFATLGSAAQALTKAAAWNPAKATSTSSTVSASASAGALAGSLSFTVDKLASAHSVASTATWTNTTDAFGLGSTLTFKDLGETSEFGHVDLVDSDADGKVSLGEAVAQINKANLGYTATAVNTGSGYQLQVTSTATGTAKSFAIVSDTQPSSAYGVVSAGQDAQITIGDGAGKITAKSATNTFTGVMDGTTFTVSQTGVSTTLKVGTDTGAITSAVSSMIDAANKAIQAVKDNTDSSEGSTAALKGNFSLIQLADQIRTKLSDAIAVPVSSDYPTGSASPASIGIQLTKDGTITFDAGKFSAVLSSNPALAQQIAGGLTGVGLDGAANTPDDTVDTDGLAARLSVLAEMASDSVSGSLVTMANGSDTTAKDIQSQIDAWTLRLQQRKDTMTAQFNALETALSSLQSQGNWLTSQINGLPKWSSSSSS
ncbi:flagellar filament capping protein FliD [Petropleomorpha daqingensis]|uniref:Flagellar hook-associated protein 2 n=1 Tax=Petropleomorpha daqingensis TaxID=2026353 RepID=A0A853CIF6_9ACTN|nr:flagellar filament capping protein FliD [Petropleomorpha daqingensis]NYJ06342.1 flagellar hook-associated protein 2 [Petropleomorpha daqingensis]